MNNLLWGIERNKIQHQNLSNVASGLNILSIPSVQSLRTSMSLNKTKTRLLRRISTSFKHCNEPFSPKYLVIVSKPFGSCLCSGLLPFFTPPREFPLLTTHCLGGYFSFMANQRLRKAFLILGRWQSVAFMPDYFSSESSAVSEAASVWATEICRVGYSSYQRTGYFE